LPEVQQPGWTICRRRVHQELGGFSRTHQWRQGLSCDPHTIKSGVAVRPRRQTAEHPGGGRRNRRIL